MELTRYEEDMLNGKYGEGPALAMRVQVALGEAFGARRMVPITRAHVALSNQDADLWFVERLVKGGARCVVSPTVNPALSLDYFPDLEQGAREMTERVQGAYRAVGASLTYSCTPYLYGNAPRYGEVVAFSESSATPYVNAVLGARTNRESAQGALCAAVTGRVPEYGLLLDENRKGNILVEVRAELRDDLDYQLLGYCADEIGEGIPVFTGIPPTVTTEQLIYLGAALNTAGAYGMYHIPGVTPEAPTLEAAFGGRRSERTVTITERDLARALDRISAREEGRIEFGLLGCPHYTPRQVRQVAELVEGRRLKTEMWICTSFFTKEVARRTGMLAQLEKAGVHLVEDTCIDQPCWNHLSGKLGVTTDVKCAYYARRRGMRFVIRSLEECVRAAVEGEIR